MPYALFSNDAQLSKAYPTEADVWKHARFSRITRGIARLRHEIKLVMRLRQVVQVIAVHMPGQHAQTPR